jgi:hypothetical protein
VEKKRSLVWAGALTKDGGGGHRCMRWMVAEAWPPAAGSGWQPRMVATDEA